MGDFNLASGCTAIIDSTSTATNVGDITVNGNLTINDGSADTLPIGNSSGNDLTNNGTLTVGTNVTLIMTNGTVDNNGTMIVSGEISTHRDFDSTGGTVSGIGILTFTGGGVGDNSIVTCSNSIAPSIVVFKTSSGLFTLSSGCTISLDDATNTTGSIVSNGTTIIAGGVGVNIERNLDASSGTVENSGSIYFDGGGAGDNSTVSCSGTIGGIIAVLKTSAGLFTLNSGCTIGLDDATNTTGSIVNSGTIAIAEGVAINIQRSLDTSSGTVTNLGTIIFEGSGAGDTTILTGLVAFFLGVFSRLGEGTWSGESGSSGSECVEGGSSTGTLALLGSLLMALVAFCNTARRRRQWLVGFSLQRTALGQTLTAALKLLVDRILTQCELTGNSQTLTRELNKSD